ncbi:hypothetical protein N185_35325 [Sinorhizobium sp. GW3]|nr:hypothetical protein N185_35325 [Sinorhizobium sp. GW3]
MRIEMIQGKNADNLRALALSGASLEVDGSKFNTQSLRAVALSLKPGATLKVVNSDSKSFEDLHSLALSRPGQIIFA